MTVEHFGGSLNCETLQELEDTLKLRVDGSVNEFWLYGEKEFPILSININRSHACLHYFAEKDLVFRSAKGALHLNPEKISTFYTNSPTEKMEIINDAVISFASALQAAKEFFSTLQRPSNVEWFQL